MPHLNHASKASTGLEPLHECWDHDDVPWCVRNSTGHPSDTSGPSSHSRPRGCTVPSTTTQGTRAAHCGIRVSVGCFKDHRSRQEESRDFQPTTGDDDTNPVTSLPRPSAIASLQSATRSSRPDRKTKDRRHRRPTPESPGPGEGDASSLRNVLTPIPRSLR